MADIAFGEVAPSVIHIIPAGWRIEGANVVTNAGTLLPLFPTLPAQYSEFPSVNGTRRFLFTDHTFRDAKGALLEDLAGKEPPLSIGGGKRSTDVLRQGGYGVGAPLVMGAANILTSAGVPDRLDAAVRDLGYDIFDPANQGGRLYAVRPEPAFPGDLQLIPANWPWLWSDGTIRLFSGGPVISGTAGTLPTIVPEAPYIPPPATSGTRDNAWGTAPVIAAALAPETDPFNSDPLTPGRGGDGLTLPYTEPATGGGGGGGSTGNPAPRPGTTLTPTATGTTGATAAPGGWSLTNSVLGLPLWAWLGAAAVIITRKKG